MVSKMKKEMNLIIDPPHEKTMWFPKMSDKNRAVQAQKMARGWKFWIRK